MDEESARSWLAQSQPNVRKAEKIQGAPVYKVREPLTAATVREVGASPPQEPLTGERNDANGLTRPSGVAKNLYESSGAPQSISHELAVELLRFNNGIRFLGGAVSVIWLAWLGLWKALGLGVLLLMLGGGILALVCRPSLLFAGPSMKLLESKHLIMASFLGVLSVIYVYAAMIGWACLSLYLFPRLGPEKALAPLLIWSYVTIPWARMASKEHLTEEHHQHWIMGGLFLALGYVVAILVLLSGASFEFACLWISIAMIFPLCAAVWVVTTVALRMNRFHSRL